MIHFKPKIQSSWGKGFLTSVLGTTVSILLTFGTSALVENKEKADIQRQTAMMVIHDIDEELADYIKNSQRSGSSVKKSDLLGQWEREFNGNEHHYFEFPRQAGTGAPRQER